MSLATIVTLLITDYLGDFNNLRASKASGYRTMYGNVCLARHDLEQKSLQQIQIFAKGTKSWLRQCALLVYHKVIEVILEHLIEAKYCNSIH